MSEELEARLRAQALRQPTPGLDEAVLRPPIPPAAGDRHDAPPAPIAAQPECEATDLVARLRALPLRPPADRVLTRPPQRRRPALGIALAIAALALLGIWLRGLLHEPVPAPTEPMVGAPARPDTAATPPSASRQQAPPPPIDGLVITPAVAGPDGAFRLCHTIQTQTIPIQDRASGRIVLVSVPIQRSALLPAPTY